jgi:hypothetical protein
MKLACLCWYIAIMLGALSAAIAFATVLPELEPKRSALYLTAALAEFRVCGLGFIVFRLPSKHWVHHSRPIWMLAIATAVTITLAVIMVG